MSASALDRDTYLRPKPMSCIECGAKGICFPVPMPGRFVCPTCSPLWLGDFLTWLLDQERAKEHLTPLADIDLPAGIEWVDPDEPATTEGRSADG